MVRSPLPIRWPETSKSSLPNLPTLLASREAAVSQSDASAHPAPRCSAECRSGVPDGRGLFPAADRSAVWASARCHRPKCREVALRARSDARGTEAQLRPKYRAADHQGRLDVRGGVTSHRPRYRVVVKGDSKSAVSVPEAVPRPKYRAVDLQVRLDARDTAHFHRPRYRVVVRVADTQHSGQHHKLRQ